MNRRWRACRISTKAFKTYEWLAPSDLSKILCILASSLLILSYHLPPIAPQLKVASLMDKRVEIHGTSRADMNGKRGVATDFHYDEDQSKWRYTVQLDSGQAFKLKPANVRADGADRGAGGRGQGEEGQGEEGAGWEEVKNAWRSRMYEQGHMHLDMHMHT